MYDFANTIFYAIVVTRYLGVQLKDLTGRHFVLFYGIFPSMVAAAFIAPWLGRFSGVRGASRKAVGLLTFSCCLFTAGLGFCDTAAALLMLFALAQVCYQLALVPYNNLLPSVASEKRMGLVSGLGVGVGYAGVLVSLPIADYAIKAFGGERYGPAYLVASGLCLLFTLPLLLFVPERATVEKGRKLELREIAALMKDRVCRRFVIGNFLCTDALNALLFLIAVYLKSCLRYEDDDILRLLLVLNVSAMIAGVLFGFLTDWITPRRAMILAAFILALSVGITHFCGSLTLAFWVIVGLGGPGVAGLWVAGRKWVVQLAPAGDVGTLFGFYGLSNKLSILNLALFTLLADWTGSYTPSVVVLVGSLLLGLAVLFTVPAARRDGS